MVQRVQCTCCPLCVGGNETSMCWWDYNPRDRWRLKGLSHGITLIMRLLIFHVTSHGIIS